MPTVTVRLPNPAHEMAQEEILKQVAHLSKRISGARFEEGGEALLFEAEAAEADQQAARVEALARKVQRALRSLERKLVYRTAAADHPTFRGDGMAPGIAMLGNGQVALEGLPLRLFRYLD